MSRPVFIILTLITAFAVAISLLLVPRQEELALMRFKNKEYGEALRRYQSIWEAGDRSISTVVPLTSLYLQHGEVDRAAELMESFVQANPDNLEARAQLGKYYQYAQRPDDYVRNLEVISALQPDESSLRDLASSYNFQGRYREQIKVLETLIQLFPDSPQDFIDLAYLQASDQQLEEALSTLQQLFATHPEFSDPDVIQLSCSLALDADEHELAFQKAEDWLSEHPETESVLGLIPIFRSKGHSQSALLLLEPLLDGPALDPRVLEQFYRSQADMGDSEAALAELEKRWRAGQLDPQLVPVAVELALTQRKSRFLLQLAAQEEIETLEDWLLLGIVRIALEQNQEFILSKVVQSPGTELWQKSPVLAARLMLALDDRASARRWMQRALADSNLRLYDRLELASLFESFGDTRSALDILQEVMRQPSLPDGTAYYAAQLFLENNEAATGFYFFEQLRSRWSSEEIDFGWALLAVASAHEDPVRHWLTQQPQHSVARLTDLYYTAIDHEAVAVATLCAHQLYLQSPTRHHRLLLARGLLGEGQLAESLQLVRNLFPGTAPEEELYKSVLMEAWKAGQPVGPEIRRYWAARGADLDPSSQEFADAASTLFEMKAFFEALPYLGALAEQQPESWLHPYAEAALATGSTTELAGYLERQLNRDALKQDLRDECLRMLLKTGAHQAAVPYLKEFAHRDRRWFYPYQETLQKLKLDSELHALWKSYAGREDLSVEEKNAVAFQLLENGFVADSERIFRQLAQEAAPNSPQVRQLLYLWGPRPDASAVGWLNRRTRIARREDISSWLSHLFDVGQYLSVTGIIEESRLLQRVGDFRLVEIYGRALIQLEEGESFRRLVDDQLACERDENELRLLGRLALESGFEKLSASVFARLLDTKPGDFEGNRVVGRQAFFSGSYSVARSHFNHYLTANPDDYEILFLQGEIHRRDHRQAAAEAAFLRAHELINKKADPTLSDRMIEARILDRLGQSTLAGELFETLMRQNPADFTVKAEYAEFLVENRRYREAENLLGTLPHKRRSGPQRSLDD